MPDDKHACSGRRYASEQEAKRAIDQFSAEFREMCTRYGVHTGFAVCGLFYDDPAAEEGMGLIAGSSFQECPLCAGHIVAGALIAGPTVVFDSFRQHMIARTAAEVAEVAEGALLAQLFNPKGKAN